MATLAPISPKFDRAIFLARHRQQTEQAIAQVRENYALSDGDRARQITEIVAEANARFLARAAGQVS
jgi:hypothetical protein